MRATRRQFMAGLGASVLSPSCGGEDVASAPVDPDAAPGREQEPDPWDPDGEVDEDRFPTGIQVGDVTEVAALISLWTSADSVDLQWRVGQGGAWAEAGVLPGLEVVDGLVQVELDSLSHDAVYAVVAVDPEDGRRSTVTRFRTALGEGDWRTITFGATSCLGGNQPWPSLSHAASEQLDFMLLLGDTVYADGSLTQGEYQEHWAEALGTQGMKDVTSSTSVVATWDDHEVADNSDWVEEGMEDQIDAALAAFRASIPQRVGPGGRGLWRHLRWGDVLDLIVLDCRGERLDGDYISAEQLDWLKLTLSESDARFKVVMTSVPITDFSAAVGDLLAEDRWQGYPHQREDLLRHVEEEEIEGVLWVAGDFHFGMAGRVGEEGTLGANQWEVLAGPGGSTLNFLADLVDPSERTPVVLMAWNWTRFVVDPSLGTIAVSFIGDEGVVLDEITLQV